MPLVCQGEICHQIASQGGNYIIAVQGNQKNMFEDIQEYFSAIKEFYQCTIEHNGRGHGRIEQGIYTCTDDIE